MQEKAILDCWLGKEKSDEPQVVIGPNIRVYIWREEDKVNNPTLYALHQSVMIWRFISFESAGTLTSDTEQ